MRLVGLVSGSATCSRSGIDLHLGRGLEGFTRDTMIRKGPLSGGIGDSRSGRHTTWLLRYFAVLLSMLVWKRRHLVRSGVGFCCDVRGVRHKWNSGFACLPRMAFGVASYLQHETMTGRTLVYFILRQHNGECAILEKLDY